MRNITKFDAEVITDMHPLFKSLLWVSAARSKDDARFILQHVHVERLHMEYCIVATDGKRLHVGTFDPGMFDDDISEIAPGDYEVIASGAKKIVLAINDEAGNYPNWRGLMPQDLPTIPDMVTRASISRIGIRSGVLLATDFVLDACGFGKGFGKDESVHVEFGSEGPGQAFLIKHELGRAIVMPMRMDGEAAESEEDATAEIPGVPTAENPVAPAPGDADEPDLLDGPRIVDAEEVKEESGISDFDVTQILVELEQTNKLQRRKKLNLLLEDHGPELIHRLLSYMEWNQPDKHLMKIIEDKAEALATIDDLANKIKPEGASDY